MKLAILAIGAHPDDVELGCGATIAKEISLGKKVGILDLTKGELGTRGSAEIRTQEAKNGAKILGVEIRENLGFADGFFVNDEKISTNNRIDTGNFTNRLFTNFRFREKCIVGFI